MRILVVEDSELVADAVRRGLDAAGFAVDHVVSAELAHAAFATVDYDAAIVDIGLPGEDGLSLLARLRQSGKSLPILILTARQAVDDRLKAFDLGADDFVIKPFVQAELIARCRALLRRATLHTSGKTALGPLQIDLHGRHLLVEGREVELTSREWAVFEPLLRHVGRTVSKDQLLQAISSFDNEVTANAVEVYVSRLRNKLGDAVTIRAIRGLGYRLDDPA
jgi:two-component system, OmpR family, response regulator